MMDLQKQAVRDFWDAASCGEALYLQGVDERAYAEQAKRRYELEPYIQSFAAFEGARGKRVLEVGVGLGADHQRFAQAGAELYGVDLTPRAVSHVQRRLRALRLESGLSVGDAERLCFPGDAFDVVYSWGVLHHSPNTATAIEEVRRVLRPGGVARIMIYHSRSFVGYMLWLRYALLALRPWRSLADIYASHLESPGTKAYTVAEARVMFARFSRVDVRVQLTHGDLLDSAAGQRHRGALLIWRARYGRALF